MSHLDNPFSNPSGKKVSCLEMLQIILDGDASEAQHHYFKNHMDECMPCYKSFQLDMQIRQLIKSKCCGDQVPPDLVERIKNQVNTIS